MMVSHAIDPQINALFPATELFLYFNLSGFAYTT